jgi:hypothetical protein
MATACVGEPDVATRTQGVLEDNKIALNKIALNKIALNKIALNKIALNKIALNGLLLLNDATTGGLISTEDGREVLSYVIGCAIPGDVTLAGEHEGVTYEFPGDIGLAPRWIEQSLDEHEQRWVSACLISRVNLFGVSVSISIRGPHASLKVSEGEARDYSAEEGAFFGNVFTPEGEPIIWNACRGRDQAITESGDLDLRDCAQPDPANPGFTMCGFVDAGDCADWTQPVNAYACRSFRKPAERRVRDDDDVLNSRDYHGGYYERCHDSAGLGNWQHAVRYPEVITVFVQPAP